MTSWWPALPSAADGAEVSGEASVWETEGAAVFHCWGSSDNYKHWSEMGAHRAKKPFQGENGISDLPSLKPRDSQSSHS